FVFGHLLGQMPEELKDSTIGPDVLAKRFVIQSQQRVHVGIRGKPYSECVCVEWPAVPITVAESISEIVGEAIVAQQDRQSADRLVDEIWRLQLLDQPLDALGDNPLITQRLDRTGDSVVVHALGVAEHRGTNAE